MVADNRKVEDSEAKATKDKLKKENEAGDLLFSVLGIHVLAGRENPPTYPLYCQLQVYWGSKMRRYIDVYVS